MGLFSPRRDPADPRQLQIAIHELGHAYAWLDAGFRVSRVVHNGDDGSCEVTWDPDNLHGYAIGCWGGFEAEDRWLRQHHSGGASRSHSSHDIRNFKHVARQLDKRLTEGKARALARRAVARHWRQIEHRAPELIRNGRLTGHQL